MLQQLLTPVDVIADHALDGIRLGRILTYATGIGDRPLVLAVVADAFPLEARNLLIAQLAETHRVKVFNKVHPNPKCSDIDTMYGDMQGEVYDAVVGIGGGSVLDSAKALAMLYSNRGTLEEYLGAGATRKIVNPALPMVLVPTTAGTGSEVTKVGVYTASSGRKHTLGSPLMHAKAAVLCGRLTASMPPALTAAVGFDALDHALESLWNKNATPVTTEAAIDAAVSVLTHLDAAYDAACRLESPTPEDIDARQCMLEASCKAGIAFSITGTAAGHALSFILSEEWHVPHGTACAFTLAGIFKLAMTDAANRTLLARIGSALFPNLSGEEELCSQLLSTILAMMKRMHLPLSFGDLSINIGKHDIARLFERAFDDPKMWNQRPKATMESILPLLEELAC